MLTPAQLRAEAAKLRAEAAERVERAQALEALADDQERRARASVSKPKPQSVSRLHPLHTQRTERTLQAVDIDLSDKSEDVRRAFGKWESEDDGNPTLLYFYRANKTPAQVATEEGVSLPRLRSWLRKKGNRGIPLRHAESLMGRYGIPRELLPRIRLAKKH